MAALSKKLRSAEGNRLHFWCPGCNEIHGVQHGAGAPPRWGWNGDADKPTFTPSVLVRSNRWDPPVTADNLGEWERSPWPQSQVVRICHSFVVDGRIQFLGDCTHALAGQTVDLPDWTEVGE